MHGECAAVVTERLEGAAALELIARHPAYQPKARLTGDVTDRLNADQDVGRRWIVAPVHQHVMPAEPACLGIERQAMPPKVPATITMQMAVQHMGHVQA